MQDDFLSRSTSQKTSEKAIAALTSKRNVRGEVVDLETMMTPLHVAAREGDVATCLFLLNDYAVKTNASDLNGRTPLLLACSAQYGTTAKSGLLSSYRCVARILLEHGANPNKQDMDGNGPLHVVVMRQDLGLLKLLIQHNALVNERNALHQTPLMLACERDWLPGVKTLLDSSAGLHYRDTKGRTALHYTSSKNVAELLVSKGAVLTAKTMREGRSALHGAAESSNFSLVRFLLVQGCNPQYKDADGKTARDLATDAKVWKLLNDHSDTLPQVKPRRVAVVDENSDQTRPALHSNGKRHLKRQSSVKASPVLRRVMEQSRKVKRSPNSQRRANMRSRLLIAQLV